MRKFAVLAWAFVFCGAAFAADPQLMNLVMPDAKVIAGVNVTNARLSPLGQFVLLQLETKQPGLQGLTAATGFDPLHDVSEVLVATPGDPSAHTGLVMMLGNFKVDAILAAIAKKQQTETHAGYTVVILSGPKAKVSGGLAFIGNTIAIAGDLPSVEAALDRKAASYTLDQGVVSQLNTLSVANDAWLTSSVALSSLPMPQGQGAQFGQILKNIQSFNGGVKFGSDVLGTATVMADTPENATALGNVAKLAISLAGMNAGNDPKLSAALQLLQTLTINTQGLAVNLALSIPEAKVESLLTK